MVNKEFFYIVCLFFKDHTHCLYKSFCDLSCSDFILNKRRIEVCYQLLSNQFVDRLTLKVVLSVEESICSLSNLFLASSWFEREVFDIFGIFFEKHPDLRRLLTDYGYEGYPLRKDFPLSGYSETRFDFVRKRVICSPLTVSQEARVFMSLSFKKSWNSISNFYFFLFH